MKNPFEKDNPSIVLVHNNRKLLELLAKTIQSEGFKVVVKNKFEDAIESILSNKSIAMIICDHCEKKNRNGLQFLEKVSILSQTTIRLLVTCCLSIGELEDHRQKGIFHLYSTMPVDLPGMLGQVKQGFELYKQSQNNWQRLEKHSRQV